MILLSKSRNVLLIISIFASIIFAQNNRGVAIKTIGPKVALVVGNSNYSNSPLKNPVNDASDIASALRQSGFNVTLKTNLTKRQF